ncbi:hypothetical protein TO64_04110 [Citrobacter freundii]|uniref:hypothetical protein n=1 Tax=Citrobacter freundii TaxID=546 RepID=UPI0005CCEC95|nr:hypothetical protein [Citrobacter freundii]KJC10669.1 hypothetical protein TO64_04110 [Citrobacter freundii]HAT4402291.1 hypothetical protein [Citrobacter freundii]
MKNNALTLVLKNDWITAPSGHIYNGTYTVGRFNMTDAFIVEYMKQIYGIEISDSCVSNGFINISDTDTRKVMYMEGCDMLSKDIMNEIRSAVKNPPDNVKIYRNGKHVIKIEMMEERNEIIL